MTTPALPSLNNYNDLSSLQSIKHHSKTDKDGALDAVAKQFESLFVSMMIKSMRDANKGFSEGNLLQSNETEFYQQMFDSQLAVTLSTNKGLGLADVIKRQLSGSVTSGASELNKGFDINDGFNLDNYTRNSFPARVKPEQLQAAVAKIEETLQRLPVPSAEVKQQSNNELDFSSPEQFIQSLYPIAKDAEQKTGIDARLMLAQSALETGWGKHQIVKQDGSPSFNLFGIKAQSDWRGETADTMTTEYRQGIAMKERASFRAYDSYDESFRDYGHFLKSNDRYQKALEQSADPKAFAFALQDSGYATDPEYGTKISQIMDRYLPSAGNDQTLNWFGE